MTDLLTREEYRAIAAKLKPATMSFVNGGFRSASSSETIATINPATGEEIGQVASCTAEDVDYAVELPIADACLEDWSGPGVSGCSMIVKPASQASLTALRVAELASEAGLPDGVLNILTGSGSVVGAAIGQHSDIDMVTFTGSTDTGRRFLRYSADSNLKEVVLEMGGKNPCIVLDDAEDLDRVAEQVVQAAFWNMGENCSAGSRLIVQSGIKGALMDRILDHARQWRTGDPLDPSNQLGALVDKTHFAKVSEYLQIGKDANHQLVLGGETRDGTYILPTVFDNVSSEDRLAREEIFGPILSVITVNSYDEAIKVANDTPYGLAASVFTANARKSLRAAQALQAGTVTVNCFGEGDITTPFGGYKQSGFGGRDNSIHAHDQFTQLKTIWVDLSDEAVDECQTR